MEGKHIKNDNFHPIIQFRKGQTFLAKSNNMARLSVIRILQYSCQHSEIICLPTGIAATVVGLFPKQRRKLKNDRITYNICGLVHSTNINTAETTTPLRYTFATASFFYTRKKEGGSVAKVPELHNHLNTVGAHFANASEFGAYYREYPY